MGLLLIAFACGTAIAVQATTNSVLSQHISQVIWVGILLFIVGLVYLLLLATILQLPTPSLREVKAAPLWSYSGGVIVASYVVAITCLVPRLGAANAIICIVAGQLFASIIIDHFGFLGVAMIKVNFDRVMACILLFISVWLIKR